MKFAFNKNENCREENKKKLGVYCTKTKHDYSVCKAIKERSEKFKTERINCLVCNIKLGLFCNIEQKMVTRKWPQILEVAHSLTPDTRRIYIRCALIYESDDHTNR